VTAEAEVIFTNLFLIPDYVSSTNFTLTVSDWCDAENLISPGLKECSSFSHAVANLQQVDAPETMHTSFSQYTYRIVLPSSASRVNMLLSMSAV